MKKDENHWDNLADRQEEDNNKFDKTVAKLIVNTKKYLKAGDTVIDYACGTGNKTIMLADSVKKIYGIDISPKAIKIAGEKAEEKGITNIEYSNKDIFDEAFKKGSFDAIIAFNILHLLDDQDSTVKRINELLKPDGFYISITPCLADKMGLIMNLQFMLFMLMKNIIAMPFQLKRFKTNEIEELVLKSGFEIIENEIFFEGLTAFYIVAKKEISL